MSIELVHLATAKLTTKPLIEIGKVGGSSRMIGEIADSVWEGERIKAKQIGAAAADWASISDAGVGQLDIRSAIETDDGAKIFVYYRGRMVFTETGPVLTVSPLFETGDERYQWLNAIQAVAKGTVDASGILTYEIYEVK